MIDAKQAISTAPRKEYYGHRMPWYMTLSYQIERSIDKISHGLDKSRGLIVKCTMKEMWPVGSRVTTYHGNGTVIKNTLLFNTFHMGGFIQTDVRYDGAPLDATQYPDVGHYNQIFLEREIS